MAKLKGPLFSNTARGSFGPRLTYSNRRTGQQARYQKENTDYETTPQIQQRSYFQIAVSWWNKLIQAEKEAWNT